MGWWLTAKPGDKVVCVDAHWPDYQLAAVKKFNVALPIERRLYTLRQIGYSAFHDLWVLRLVEIVNGRFKLDSYNFGEPFFAVHRFRPLVARPTDISIFTAMLGPQGASRPAAPAPQHEGADR